MTINKKDIEAVYPLSPMQQGILFHTLEEPESGFYFQQDIYDLYGELDFPCFERAWQTVVKRHAILRTAFSHLGQMSQLVLRQANLPIHRQDLRRLTADAQEQHLRCYLEQDRRRGFNLSNPPIMRLALLQITDDHYHLVWSSHHILMDAWSGFLLVKEIAAFYAAFRRGEDLVLPSPRPYQDYIAWLQRQDLKAAETYWRNMLQGLSEPTQLPSDRLAESDSDRHERILRLSPCLSSELQQLARRYQLTLNTVIQGAWAILLSRYSRRRDVVFGVTVSHRPPGLAGIESMIGLFINTVPVRAQFERDEPLIKFLGQLQHWQAELIQYAHTPLNRIRRWSSLALDVPLFESLYVFENVPEDIFEQTYSMPEPVKLSRPLGLRVHRREYNYKINFPITLVVSPYEEVSLRLIYDSGRFAAPTIDRMLQHLQMLLGGMVEAPERSVSELSMVSAAEQRQILGLNETARTYPRDKCIHELFEEQVERRPDKAAVACGGRQMSYAEVNARANQLARRLRGLGVGPEVCVGVYLERSIEMVVGLLGILKAGGAYLPLDLGAPVERLSFMLKAAGANVLLTSEQWLKVLPSWPQAVCLDSGWQNIAQQRTRNIPCTTTAENLAYIIYTSGSTGTPKGVQIPHRGVLRLICGVDYANLDEQQVILQAAPLAFDASTFELWGALLRGACCVLFEESIPTAQTLGKIVERYGIRTMWLTSALFNAVMDEDGQALSGVEQLLIGGEALSVRDVRRARSELKETRLINGYGPTEATTFTCCYDIKDVPRGAASIPIGRPVSNTDVYVLDERMQLVPFGVPGELHIGGDGLARGYLNSPDLTAQKFVPHPFSKEAGARLYRTGDLVRLRPDGNIEFLGRLDHQMKIRGYRVESREIETVLSGHAAVRECVIVMRERVTGEKCLVAYVVGAVDREAPTASELREYLRQWLPEYMIPSAYVWLDDLPLTPHGKVDRKALPAPDWAPAQRYVAPRTKAEEALCHIWAQVLRIQRVGIHDNFFELGGDSIISIQIAARANQAGLMLKPRQLFQNQTIVELAQVVETKAAFEAGQDLIIGPAPLTPIQSWFFEQEQAAPNHFNQALLLKAKNGINPARLSRAIEALVAHHDALRLRFRRQSERWTQVNSGLPQPGIFLVIDLSSLPAGDRPQIIKDVSTRLQASLDLESGPLLRTACFTMGDAEPARLLLVIHHLAVDGVSWRILLEDLQTAYGQAERGEPIWLPAKTTSFRTWAEALASYATSATVWAELEYWRSQGVRASVPLPLDHQLGENTIASTLTVSVELNVDETAALLRRVPRVYHTQINDVLLTALALALAEWTGQRELLVELEGHGREEIFEKVDLSRTVGWFTTIYPVLLRLDDRGEPKRHLLSVKEQLQAIPRHGIGYGLLRYLNRDAEVIALFRNLAQAEISFNYLGQFDQVFTQEALFIPGEEPTGPSVNAARLRSHLLEINSRISRGRFCANWSYSQNLHRRGTIERLASSFCSALRTMISASQSINTDALSPSDFPLAGVDGQQLGRIIEQLKKVKGDGITRWI